MAKMPAKKMPTHKPPKHKVPSGKMPVNNDVNQKIMAMHRARARQNAAKNRAKSNPNVGTNNYAAGDPVYGAGRPMPTIGPVDKTGYRERDLQASAKKKAIAARLKATQSGNFGSANAMRGGK